MPLSSHELTPRIVNDVEFHPDGNCIAVATNDNVVKVRMYIHRGLSSLTLAGVKC